jgi:hypothetical protein
LVRKPNAKKPLGRPRPEYRWEDNIKVYLKETGCKGGVYSIFRLV